MDRKAWGKAAAEKSCRCVCCGVRITPAATYCARCAVVESIPKLVTNPDHEVRWVG